MTCLAGHSDESSDEEPLINLVKKKCTDKQTKTKTKAPKTDTTPKKPREMSGKDSEVTEIKMFSLHISDAFMFHYVYIFFQGRQATVQMMNL